ncbi:hypothetical protein RUR49_06715 [Pseudoxanthobacter sp. M-2]|uniref:calcium-binding protein n=1 Tax=Pseudoxanthobacter sp. M-2 TaxID=3078754 RepID=UPI0038FC57AE
MKARFELKDTGADLYVESNGRYVSLADLFVKDQDFGLYFYDNRKYLLQYSPDKNDKTVYTIDKNGHLDIVNKHIDSLYINIRDSDSNFGITTTKNNDVIKLGDGDDVVLNLGGRDKIYGYGGDDLIRGCRDGERIFGGNGDDQIQGRGGRDILTGGRGEDNFEFTVGRETESVIRDFKQGKDHIKFRGDDLNFDDLTITRTKAGSVVSYEDMEIRLNGVKARDIDDSDFLF